MNLLVECARARTGAPRDRKAAQGRVAALSGPYAG